MKAKHYSLIALALIFSANAWSQMTFIPRGGFNYSTITEKDDNNTYNDNKKFLAGYHIGALANFELTDVISFRAGVLATGRGVKTDSETTDTYDFGGTTTTITTSYKSTTSLTYIEVPIAINFGFDMGDSRLNVGFGPYVSYGIAGKTKWESKTSTTVGSTTNSTENSGNDNIKWGSDQNNDDLKPLDFGVYPTLGMDFGRIEIELSYRMGLSNISPYDQNGYRANNKVMMFSLGYIIGDI